MSAYGKTRLTPDFYFYFRGFAYYIAFAGDMSRHIRVSKNRKFKNKEQKYDETVTDNGEKNCNTDQYCNFEKFISWKTEAHDGRL